MQVHYFTAIFIFMFTIKGSQSQYNCCKKKELDGITYVLTKYTGLNPDPKCLNDCIYQIEGNNDKYYCFGEGGSPPQCIAEDYNELPEISSTCHDCLVALAYGAVSGPQGGACLSNGYTLETLKCLVTYVNDPEVNQISSATKSCLNCFCSMVVSTNFPNTILPGTYQDLLNLNCANLTSTLSEYMETSKVTVINTLDEGASATLTFTDGTKTNEQFISHKNYFIFPILNGATLQSIDVAISGSTCSNDAGGIGTYFINSQDDSTCEISGPY